MVSPGMGELKDQLEQGFPGFCPDEGDCRLGAAN
jgi:hypothetical protein